MYRVYNTYGLREWAKKNTVKSEEVVLVTSSPVYFY